MAAIQLAFQSGIIDKVSCRLAVYSLSSADFSISVDGTVVNGALTPIARGLDGDATGVIDSGDIFPVALYTAVIDLTGLSGRHALSITQGANTRTGFTNVDYGDVDSQAIFMTCDTKDSSTSGVGAFKGVRAYCEDPANKVQTVIHTDDHGYVDTMGVDDRGNGGSGRFCGQPQDDKTAYSYYLSYAAYLGLIETDVAGIYVPDFHELDRIWLRENIPKWTSTGDHEIVNDPESNDTITAAWSANAKEAYQNTVGATTPIISANSAAWVLSVGSMQVVSYDRIFSLPPLTSLYDTATETNTIANNKWLGNAQIADIKSKLDTTSPFKMLAMSAGLRHITTGSFRLSEKGVWTKSAMFGAQQPIHDYTSDTDSSTLSHASEWRDLMTKNLDSVCAVANSYGAPVFGCHGDTHRPYEYWHFTPQDANNVELDFIECSAGAVNPNFAHNLHTSIAEGYYFRGTTVDWLVNWTPRTNINGDGFPTYIALDMKGGGDITVKYMESDAVSTNTVLRETVIKRNKPLNERRISTL